MKKENLLISIVVPFYHEEKNVEILYDRLKKSLEKITPCYEFIFVDDGSCDLTFQKLQNLSEKDSRITVIKFSRNFGHHIAITAGLDYASGDYVVMMDGDLQDQPEEIARLYEKILEGYDVVYGERVHKKFSWFRRFLSSSFVRFIQFLIDEPIVINSTIFRIMTRQVVDEVCRLREHHRYIVGLIGWVGFKHAFVSVEHGKRVAGETKYSFYKQLKLAFDAIFSFSDYPLKIISRLGFLFVILSFCMGFYIVLRHIFFQVPVMGWASLITAIFFTSGLNIFLLGIIGEYLGRSYVEIKQRPLYVIEKILNKKENRHKERG